MRTVSFSDFHSGFTVDFFASKYEKNHFLKKTENKIVLCMIVLYIGLYFSVIKTDKPVVKIKKTNIVNYKLATSQSTFSLLLT